MVKQCLSCAKDATPRKEPMIPTPLPDYPWQRVGTDLFYHKGTNYLLVVDYFSRYPEILKLTSYLSQHHKALKTIFSRHGVPETVQSDNGPQYASQEFAEFAKAYNFSHVTSSPHFPQSNGQAERTVQTVKNLVKQSKDPLMALLTYRTTPFPWCKLSPAELLMGRRLQSNIPLVKDQLVPEWKVLDEFRRCNQDFKDKQEQNYDRRYRTQPHPTIPDDSDVWITTDSRPVPGRVLSSANTPRSYLIETPTGQVRRNRQHLNPVPNNSPVTEESNAITPPNIIQTRSRTGTTILPPNRL